MAGEMEAKLHGMRVHLADLRQVYHDIKVAGGKFHFKGQYVEDARVEVDATIPCDPTKDDCGATIFRSNLANLRSPDKLDRENLTRCAGCPFALQPHGSVIRREPKK